ncbi:MAG: hypothetical protein DMG37_20260 [Acidobacteria bacterium]|nr:MAG: hypothetical protein DMG37_20260 [Acidobacteriota bacterium]
MWLTDRTEVLTPAKGKVQAEFDLAWSSKRVDSGTDANSVRIVVPAYMVPFLSCGYISPRLLDKKEGGRRLYEALPAVLGNRLSSIKLDEPKS